MSHQTKVRVTGVGPKCPKCGVQTYSVEVIEDSPPEVFSGDKGYYCPSDCYKQQDSYGQD